VRTFVRRLMSERHIRRLCSSSVRLARSAPTCRHRRDTAKTPRCYCSRRRVRRGQGPGWQIGWRSDLVLSARGYGVHPRCRVRAATGQIPVESRQDEWPCRPRLLRPGRATNRTEYQHISVCMDLL
jgi:hypothetical protein